MTADGPSLREGNRNLKPTSAESEEATSLRSFEWRGGVERMTTGIWVWSEPFVRRTEGGKEVAVLLVDTQGMFDNETSMGLTACIFAVSTLVRSWLGLLLAAAVLCVSVCLCALFLPQAALVGLLVGWLVGCVAVFGAGGGEGDDGRRW